MLLKKKIVSVVFAFFLLAGMFLGVQLYKKFTTPYFSIIISTYNYGNYVSQTIDSVLASSYQNFELIVVNDGSTDKTSEVLKKYKKHPKVTVIEHENQGLSLSRNKAMKIAKGKYFWFVDADDWIDEKALEYLYKKTKGTKLDLVSFYVNNFREKDVFLAQTGYELLPAQLKNNPDNVFTIDDLTAREILKYPVTSGKQIYRRKFIQENNIEFPPKTLFEDDVFFLHALFVGAKFSPIKKVLYYKRVHPSSIVADKGKHFDSFLRICEFIWERTHQYPKYEEKATFVSNAYINAIYSRWDWLTGVRKYKFYPDLLKWMDFVAKQPNNEYWSKKRKEFELFMDSDKVAKYKIK